MGFAVWIDTGRQVVWARGTHEYRPMGAAAIALTDRFRARDFRQSRRVPAAVHTAFVGFFGSLEDINARLRSAKTWRRRATPAHLR